MTAESADNLRDLQRLGEALRTAGEWRGILWTEEIPVVASAKRCSDDLIVWDVSWRAQCGPFRDGGSWAGTSITELSQVIEMASRRLVTRIKRRPIPEKLFVSKSGGKWHVCGWLDGNRASVIEGGFETEAEAKEAADRLIKEKES